jgi:hypothetical protein
LFAPQYLADNHGRARAPAHLARDVGFREKLIGRLRNRPARIAFLDGERDRARRRYDDRRMGVRSPPRPIDDSASDLYRRARNP